MRRSDVKRSVHIALLAATLAVASAGWACKDDSGDSLTLEEYFQQIEALDDNTQTRVDAAFEEITDEGDVQQFRDAIKKLGPALEDAAEDLGDIDPPSEVKAEHKAFSDALENWAEVTTDEARDIDNIKASTPDELFVAFEETGFGAAQDDFNSACKDLLQVAIDNNIDLNMNCDDEEGEVTAAEQTIRDAAAAWNASDVEALAALFTDAGLNSAFGQGEEAPREEILASLEEEIGAGAIEIRELSAELTDAGADANLLWLSGHVLEHFRFSLVLDDDQWKIDGQEELQVEVPSNYEVVNVDLNEFAFAFDAAAIPSGTPFALEVHNAGQQMHHLLFAKIPEGPPVEELLMTDEDVPGFENIGGLEPIASGDESSMVVAGPLDAGRYVFVCFLPDTTEGPAGTPHAFKGMVADFTVGASASTEPAP
jgi:hypothetical protein